jgi:hypothetical protein
MYTRIWFLAGGISMEEEKKKAGFEPKNLFEKSL